MPNGEQARIVDDFTFEQSVELVGIDAMRALDFAVQARGSGSDLDVSDAHVEQVPVEGRAEFLAVVRVDRLDLQRQIREDVVDELNRDLLVVARVRPQKPAGNRANAHVDHVRESHVPFDQL